MPTSGGLTSDEANSAAWEAGRGAVAGAAKVRTSSRWGDIWTNRVSGVLVLPFSVLLDMQCLLSTEG
jgi:hypothetical protein